MGHRKESGNLAVSQERRRYVRLGTEHNIGCEIAGVDIVHIVGLGSDGGGMRVITNRELPPGDFPVKLTLDDGGDSIAAFAKVAWHKVQDFEFTQRHFSGLILFQLEPASADRLNHILNQATAAGGEEDHED
jgi:hypothetical protein